MGMKEVGVVIVVDRFPASLPAASGLVKLTIYSRALEIQSDNN